MLVLFETPAGYALFKLLDKGKLEQVQDLHHDFSAPDKAAKIVKLQAFSKFEDTAKALAAAAAICEGTLDKGLKKFLKENVAEKAKLAVSDLKLANAIKEKLDIKCVYNESVLELMRGIRSQLDTLLSGISVADREAMRLGLSHSLCRYTLKFSPDKVDTMIIQAISLLDELDKELNTYAMRVREWYGWHFPEMAKIVNNDTILYAKIVKKMGVRTNASKTDFSDILSEEVEKDLKETAEVSMGTEVADEDILNIKELCDQVISIAEYRTSLFDYLRNRMNAIAPNLTVMVGELVGARLIAHAGSLMNLAKQPASTVQILGAEKALFRALKTKHATPKYGLIYHASLVGQAPQKLKGKISRVLAAKTALSIRADALGDTDGVTIGIHHREQVESRLRDLELGNQAHNGNVKKKPSQEKYTKPSSKEAVYNTASDAVVNHAAEKEKKKEKKIKTEAVETNGDAPHIPAAETTEKKKKKDKKVKQEPEAEVEMAVETKTTEDISKEEKKKKKDKKVKQEAEVEVPHIPAVESTITDEISKEEKKKKKKEKRALEESAPAEEVTPAAPAEDGEKKAKKAKKAKKEHTDS